MEGRRNRAPRLRAPTLVHVHIAVVGHMHRLVTTFGEACVMKDVTLGNNVAGPFMHVAPTSLLALVRRLMAMARTIPCHFLSQDARPERSGAAAATARSQPEDVMRGVLSTAASLAGRTAVLGRESILMMGRGRNVLSGAAIGGRMFVGHGNNHMSASSV